MSPNDNIDNTNDKNISEIYETNIMTNHSIVENCYMMTWMVQVRIKMYR